MRPSLWLAGASGVDITNQTGVSTDFRGYTVVPFIAHTVKTRCR
ncbi:MAG: hypothetical protein ACLR9W_01615 [Enterobacter hormaechei]